MRDILPTEVYMLRNKVTGKLYRRKYSGGPLVWTGKQGPASAKGSIRGPTRKDWRTVILKVNESCIL